MQKSMKLFKKKIKKEKQKKKTKKKSFVRLGLVTLFNGTSTYMGYLMRMMIKEDEEKGGVKKKRKRRKRNFMKLETMNKNIKNAKNHGPIILFNKFIHLARNNYQKATLLKTLK